MALIAEYLPAVIGLIVFALFTIGLALALRSEQGRTALADGAVALALALLRLAEGWLAEMIGQQSQAKRGRISQARAILIEGHG